MDKPKPNPKQTLILIIFYISMFVGLSQYWYSLLSALVDTNLVIKVLAAWVVIKISEYYIKRIVNEVNTGTTG